MKPNNPFLQFSWEFFWKFSKFFGVRGAPPPDPLRGRPPPNRNPGGAAVFAFSWAHFPPRGPKSRAHCIDMFGQPCTRGLNQLIRLKVVLKQERFAFENVEIMLSPIKLTIFHVEEDWTLLVLSYLAIEFSMKIIIPFGTLSSFGVFFSPTA